MKDPRTYPLPLDDAADDPSAPGGEARGTWSEPTPVPGLWPSPGVEQNTRMNANEAVMPSADAATRVIV